MPESLALPSLTPREAVADALHRCILGLDSNDRPLFESAFVQDESTLFVGGSFKLEGWPAINSFCAKLFDMITTHIVSNVRVEVQEGADTARLTAHALAYHLQAEGALAKEDTSYRAANLYEIELVRDGADGLWKIKKWVIETLWTTGDINVLHS